MSGRYTAWSVPAQTHIKTFEYFHLIPEDFMYDESIAAGLWIVNLNKERFRQRVLSRWIDCAVDAQVVCLLVDQAGSCQKASKIAGIRFSTRPIDKIRLLGHFLYIITHTLSRMRT